MVKNPHVEMIVPLEETLRHLKAQYDMFFAGSRPLPPTEEHKRFDKRMRELSTMRIRDNTARFRFNNVMNKYTLYREMWNRQIREREEGPLRYQQRVAAYQKLDSEAKAPVPQEDPRASQPVTRESIESYVRVRDSEDGSGIQALHDKLSEARRQTGSPAISLLQVSAMIVKQMETLKSKYELSAVDFRVEVVDGKVRLKAKPIQDRHT